MAARNWSRSGGRLDWETPMEDILEIILQSKKIYFSMLLLNYYKNSITYVLFL